MSTSLWSNSLKSGIHYPTLDATDLHFDVVIIGGGIAGLASAYLLQKSGKHVCVLEADEIGSGQTSRTTAHITTSLDTRYYQLQNLHGNEGARLAAESHQSAKILLQEIIQNEKIDCNEKIVDGYLLFSASSESLSELQKELAAAHASGLKDVHEVLSIPNFPNFSGPALCFPNQLQIHPLKFLFALSEKFIQAGGKIYSHTPVVQLKGGAEAYVTTTSDKRVWCDHIIIATNSPIHDIFAIHTKQAPYRSYVIAARIPKGSVGTGLYWDNEDPYHYLRLESAANDSNSDILMVGGEDHKTGQNDVPELCYLRLERWARERFPMMQEITDHWSGQVMEPVDGLAFIGHNPLDRKNVYVITGHSGNGMTYGLIGAQLIRDQIDGRPNAWEKLYSPSRKNFRAIKTFIEENANAAAQYTDWLSAGDFETTDDVPRGDGGTVREGAHLIAAYRDAHGLLTTVSAVCPHLGGIVRWNASEKSWDCPCHGSRFDAKGSVIEGPACSGLKPYLKPEGTRISPDFKPQFLNRPFDFSPET